jgi:hypothetical protein
MTENNHTPQYVWLFEQGCEHEGGWVVGVYASREAAIAAVEAAIAEENALEIEKEDDLKLGTYVKSQDEDDLWMRNSDFMSVNERQVK